MACGTVVGQSLEFGISHDEASLVTQTVSVTKKKDKKEVRDKCGIVVSVAYYNLTQEVTVEGFGLSTAAPGATLALAGGFSTVTGTIYIDEVTIAKENEGFVKSTIKATAYSGIT